MPDFASTHSPFFLGIGSARSLCLWQRSQTPMGLISQFPPGLHGTHLARQITKAATSAAPNYAEARAAESRADFIHKMAIALKELNETQVWLRMAGKRFGLESACFFKLLAENREKCRVFLGSIQKAKRNRRG